MTRERIRSCELVRFLLGYGVHPTNRTLSRAVWSGNQQLVQSLLDAGAYANRLPNYEIEPLADAIRSRNGRMVELLESKGAWTHITEKSQFIALLNVASEVGEIEIARNLLGTGTRFKARELTEPLRAAIRGRHEVIAEM